MPTFFPTFPVGSVGHTLLQARGTWHEQVELFNLDGSPLSDDTEAGSGAAGPSPYDSLIYLDFDGQFMKQTNVSFRGREVHANTFAAELIDGVLQFDSLGPGAFENIGVSGGPGILIYNSRHIDEACKLYQEPDFIVYTSPGHRLRTTLLYSNGEATRTCTGHATRLSPTCDKRADFDPRGSDGDVHEKNLFTTQLWASLDQ